MQDNTSYLDFLPGTASTTLKCIIKELNNSPLEHLSLTNSHIDITHVDHLIRLVRMNSNLIHLNLSDNDLNKAIPLLSSTLDPFKNSRNIS